MENFFAQLSPRDTIIHKLDTRVKILSVIGFIMISSSLQSASGLAAGAAFILFLLMAVGAPLSLVGRRLAWVMLFGGAMLVLFPFITPGRESFSWQAGFLNLTATEEGILKASLLFLRLLSAVLAVTLLNATTSFREILHGFRKLHMPGLLVDIIEFTVRYFFVLGDELNRMKLARQARAYDLGKSIFRKNSFKTIAQMISVLLLRSMGRAERVYLAMLARGYHGQPQAQGSARKSDRVQAADLLWGIGFVCMTLSIKLLEAGGLIG